MKTFTTFIAESTDKHVVFAFGRMNPPTTGHEKLVEKVKSEAKKQHADHEIVVSHTQDAKKNPLTAAQKLKHAKRFFPGANIHASSKEHPSFIHHAKRLNAAGYTHLTMVAGSDRVEEMHKLLHKYNGKEFNFKHIKVVSAGHRDPDAEGTAGMSASKMRDHAKSGDFKSFRKGVPGHVSDQHAKELYDDVRKGSE
jgi:nicotinic acid mononucleotide adenylyltransferase